MSDSDGVAAAGGLVAGDFRLAPSLARALSGAPVRVGTENPAKLDAVRLALGSFAESPDSILLVPVGVASGVPEQPVGWDEIARGARNRARAALASGDGVLGVGIEDGLVRLSGAAPDASMAVDAATSGRVTDRRSGPADPEDLRGVFNVGCAWVTDGVREGSGFSSAFAYPPDCLGPAFREATPIGDLFDALWRARRGGSVNASHPEAGAQGGALRAEAPPSGRQGGNIGLLTQGRLPRSAYGAQAIVCALVHFLHTDLYDWGPRQGTL
ncbi:MAG: DUF84 family protein [Spirochaetaceae bacterium]|nr:DUF84 family protein [Myxococcales bacterium]MCB9724037.1 DUF84 family protein [Spirochaetaceae bacterium]HPG24535.1 DUF84 family protein [Myxococcota bacterium]